MSPKLDHRGDQGILNKETAGIYFLYAYLFHQAPHRNLLLTIINERLLTKSRDFRSQCVGSFDAILEDPQWLHQEEKTAVEFASLFVIPGCEIIVPYESYYCDTLTIDYATACSAYFQSQAGSVSLKGFLGGCAAQSVRNRYKESGFEIDPAFFDLPDHVSAELEFMGKLYALGDCAQAENFYCEHLGRWIHLFLNKILQQTGSYFYRAVAESLKGFLREEKASVNNGEG